MQGYLGYEMLISSSEMRLSKSSGAKRDSVPVFYLPYLFSIHEKAMYRYVLDGKSALAWELSFPGHLSST